MPFPRAWRARPPVVALVALFAGACAASWDDPSRLVSGSGDAEFSRRCGGPAADARCASAALEALAALRRACASGDGASCARLSRAELGLTRAGAPAPLARYAAFTGESAGRLARLCERGDAAACEDVATLRYLGYGLPRSADAAVGESLPPPVRRAAGRACLALPAAQDGRFETFEDGDLPRRLLARLRAEVVPRCVLTEEGRDRFANYVEGALEAEWRAEAEGEAARALAERRSDAAQEREARRQLEAQEQEARRQREARAREAQRQREAGAQAARRAAEAIAAAGALVAAARWREAGEALRAAHAEGALAPARAAGPERQALGRVLDALLDGELEAALRRGDPAAAALADAMSPYAEGRAATRIAEAAAGAADARLDAAVAQAAASVARREFDAARGAIEGSLGRDAGAWERARQSTRRRAAVERALTGLLLGELAEQAQRRGGGGPPRGPRDRFAPWLSRGASARVDAARERAARAHRARAAREAAGRPHYAAWQSALYVSLTGIRGPVAEWLAGARVELPRFRLRVASDDEACRERVGRVFDVGGVSPTAGLMVAVTPDECVASERVWTAQEALGGSASGPGPAARALTTQTTVRADFMCVGPSCATRTVTSESSAPAGRAPEPVFRSVAHRALRVRFDLRVTVGGASAGVVRASREHDEAVDLPFAGPARGGPRFSERTLDELVAEAEREASAQALTATVALRCAALRTEAVGAAAAARSRRDEEGEEDAWLRAALAGERGEAYRAWFTPRYGTLPHLHEPFNAGPCAP